MKKKFGHYEVVSELGRGGMGVVYKAWEPSLNRHVAIKVLGEHLLGDEALAERFTREAKAMAAINHPNVIQVYFIGMEGNQPYFAMEFIEGVSLDDILRGNKAVSVPHAKEILRQSCVGLAVAHKAGLVHRDIKPANLMVCNDGTVKVVDFGIAQTREYGDKLTNTGEFVGTPGYLSPEVCTGKEVDARSDIFALGIVFYEMLAGKVPFENESPLGLMLEVVQSNIPDIREINKKVDRKTSYVLHKMIAKNPEERFQNCDEIVRQLGVLSVPLSIADIQQKTIAVDTAQVKAKISEQITLPGEAAVTENKMVPVEHKKSGGKWLITTFVLAAVSAGAFGVYYGYIPVPGFSEEKSYLAASGTDSTTDSSIVQASSGINQPGSTTSSQEPNALFSGLSSAFSSDEPDDSKEKIDNGMSVSDVKKDAYVTAETKNINAQAPDVLSDEKNSVTSLDMPNIGIKVKSEDGITKAAADMIDVSVTSKAADKIAAHTTQAEKTTVSVDRTLAHVEHKKTPVVDRPIVRKLNKGVAVLVFGDPAVANPIEKILESELKRKNIKVLNEQFVPGLSKIMSEGADLAMLRQSIMKFGGSAMVVANVNHVGEQTLEYYGRSSQLINAQLDVDTYDLRSGDSIGSGFGAKLSYTSLNATEQAEEALMGFIDEFVGDLAQR